MNIKSPTILVAFSMLFLSAKSTLAANDALSMFSKDVVIHVLYHELAHALISEFDVPVLTNEEAMADSFATIAVTTWHRDRAPEIISSRVRSWIYEDAEISSDRYDFKGEHQLDIRRAYQAGCLFYGLDPVEFEDHVKFLDFSEDELADCSDTAPDQEAGWQSVLASHVLFGDVRSPKVEVIFGEGPLKAEIAESGIIQDFADDVARFDWPKAINIHFDHCDRSAFWSRTTRTIMLCDDYVQRFIDQGLTLAVNQQ